jgi:hypothetical protein
MSRSPSKKGFVERRKRPRSKKGGHRETAHKTVCAHCAKALKNLDRALFVEEEVGRIFCSEECISEYFAPDIARLEKEYFRRLEEGDIPQERREEMAYLRWLTLEEPDEAWCRKMPSGDYQYTLISEFKPAGQPVWCICICLFLRGEPSFMFISFPTMKASMVEHYRRGERVEIVRQEAQDAQDAGEKQEAGPTDGLADAWTADETVRARISVKRRDGDIPREDFKLYQACIEETLQAPDEVWSLKVDEAGTQHVFHFLRHYPSESPEMWFVIIARELVGKNQLEIIDAFPTRDKELVARHRQGELESGEEAEPTPSRMVH